MDALNVIIAGRSGSRKTRFMVNYVCPIILWWRAPSVRRDHTPEIRQYLQSPCCHAVRCVLA